MPWVLFAFVIATGAPSLACGEGWDYEGMQEPPFGLAAVVLNHGVVAKTVYIGRNGTWFGRPVDGDSVFEGASLGKTLASWLALRMVAEGRLELDRPLSAYTGAESWAVPAVLGDRITLRHVLTHTSGLDNRVVPPNPAVGFEPGSQFQYSGNGFYLLQQAIEAATGESVEETVRRELFEPLQMANSSFEPQADVGDAVLPSMPVRWAIAVASLMIVTGSLVVLAVRLILKKLKPASSLVLKMRSWHIAATGALTTSVIAGILLGPLHGAYLLLLQLALAAKLRWCRFSRRKGTFAAATRNTPAGAPGPLHRSLRAVPGGNLLDRARPAGAIAAYRTSRFPC